MDLGYLKRFIDHHWDGRRPLLLGYSGGPDSKALLYALLEIGFRSFHVAHVDHGWREESGAEALQLRAEILSLQLPFHSVRLEASPAANREETARKERLRYFQGLCEELSFQALLLGHQADDQIETVLKRVFEGAHLCSLGGMEAVSQLEGVSIWRPFLKTQRKELIAFLEKKGMVPLWDPTNEDPVYLRSRLRAGLLPFLNRSFGKAVGNNLQLLGQRAVELKHYLNRKTADHPILKGPWGTASHLSLLERVEQRHVLQTIFEQEGIRSCPRSLLETLLEWIGEKRVDLASRIGLRDLIIDRGWLFVLRGHTPQFAAPILLGEGCFESGDWMVKGEIADEAFSHSFDWASIWQGLFTLRLPVTVLQKRFFLQMAKKKSSFAQTPAFLRSCLPVLQDETGKLYRFFNGKALPEKGRVFKLTIQVGSSP